jgi:hypothetical protein
MLVAGVALLGLQALLIFARSSRYALSGPISTALGLATIPAAVAALWLLAVAIGWWTVLAFVVQSFVAGAIVRRDNLGAWINLQPGTGVVFVACIAGAWALHLAERPAPWRDPFPRGGGAPVKPAPQGQGYGIFVEPMPPVQAGSPPLTPAEDAIERARRVRLGLPERPASSTAR